MNSKVNTAFVVFVMACPHGAQGAPTKLDSNTEGYLRCDLKSLADCQNTNQIFNGVRGRHYNQFYRKKAFPAAIKQFLSGAPKHGLGKFSFSADQVAEESLWGPGERYQFPAGELLFDGFTPHDAPDCAAVIFRPNGEILLIATLNRDDSDKLHQHLLRIYTHGTKPKAEFIQYLQNWAHKAVDNLSNYPGLPKDIFTGTEYLVKETGNRWTSEREP